MLVVNLFHLLCRLECQSRERSSSGIQAALTGIDLVPVEEEKVTVPRGASWAVHKFGGTCVGTFERIENVAKIIVGDPWVRKVAVVSAMSKVTDMMYDLLHRAEARDESYLDALENVHTKHKDTAIALLQEGEDLSKFLTVLENDVLNLRAMLRAICIGMANFPYPMIDAFMVNSVKSATFQVPFWHTKTAILVA